jgi:hypothetical protein
MLLLDKLDFKPDDVRVITDKNPWDPPTKENIVGHLCEISQLAFTFFVQLDAMRALVRDAKPHDSFFLYGM